MTESAEQMTNADFARQLATLHQIVSREMRDHVQGMWNPLYCSADANAGYVLQEIRDWLEHAEQRASLSPTKD